MGTAYNKYQDFREEDFINDEYFQDWIIYPDREKTVFWNGFITNHPNQKEIIEKAKLLLTSIDFKEDWPADERIQASLQKALHRINQHTGIVKETQPQSFRVKQLYKRWWAVAAIVLVAVSVYTITQHELKNKNVAIEQPISKNDIAPGGNKAVLTLADGSAIVLDNAANGTLANQQNAMVMKLADGKLAYEQQPAVITPSSIITYNTVSTPRGGQYQVVLADGTKVWLNAASSLRFPTRFNDKERRVEVTGEVYFEVAHNAQMPFIVIHGDVAVQVLGTHFNVNAYDDEENMKVTLLEGKVNVETATTTALLDPGQQAQISNEPSKNKHITISENVDLEEVVAWKNGKFQFGEAADMGTVLRQIARWYDVDLTYDTKITGHIGGSISRGVNLSHVLDMLEMTGSVKFKIDGKKVEVIAK